MYANHSKLYCTEPVGARGVFFFWKCRVIGFEYYLIILPEIDRKDKTGAEGLYVPMCVGPFFFSNSELSLLPKSEKLENIIS